MVNDARPKTIEKAPPRLASLPYNSQKQIGLYIREQFTSCD